MEAAIAEVHTGRIEREDFDRIVPEHQKQIYRILLCLVRDADIADTLTQECFLRAYRKRGSFRGECSLGTWLVRIAINLAHDHNRNQRWAFWRKFTRTDKLESLENADCKRSPESALIDRESVNAILSVVANLSERQKTVFLLHYVEEMPLEAIANALELETGTVKAHLSRALETVRSTACKHGHR